MNPIAWTADITKAFLQIELTEEDSHAVRFLWVENPEDPQSPIIEYRWLRVPFGLTSSPFILRAVILKHLRLYEDRYPDTVRQLREQLYVDDWIGGAKNLKLGIKTIKEARIIFSDAHMELRKWTTNSRELQTRFADDFSFNDLPTKMGQENAGTDAKALGMIWDQKSDQFRFNPDKLLAEAAKVGHQPTKRQVFSLAAKIFDPMGLVSPVVLVAKIITQRIWETKIHWDVKIPPQIATQWHTFVASLHSLRDIKIPRWIGSQEQIPTEIHIFCDASEDGYGAAVYLLQKSTEFPPEAHLFCSKTRIAPSPKKSMTIPRLELISNLLAARLAKYTTKSIGGCYRTYVWTDSMIALWWIRGDSGRWKTFVNNRVIQIQNTFTPDSIKHCPGLDNPADLASRGTSADHLALEVI